MDGVKIGTSGYSYDDWVGPFYPEDMPKHERLRHYSLFFPFVELNFSYYRMPEARGLLRMADETPEGFLFSIKAHSSLTHEVSEAWKEDVAKFRSAAGALKARGRLACVVVQLPYRFHYTTENRFYLSGLVEELAELPLAVEFRNDEWMNPKVYAELERRNVALVCTDSPDLPGLPRREAIVTSDLAYVRFHGRNSAAWWTGDNATRYDYLYDAKEIGEWVPKLKAMKNKSKLLLVAFNNHHKGQAIRNGKELSEALDYFSVKV